MEKFCEKVVKGIPSFLSSLNTPLGYKFNPSSSLNLPFLASSVFCTKILYMIDKFENEHQKIKLAEEINNFQSIDGSISDKIIEKKSRLSRWLNPIRSGDFNNIFNQLTKRAETRQSFAALMCLGIQPKHSYEKIPFSFKEIEKYIDKLNWNLPWGAASHFSHLIFFLVVKKKFFPSLNFKVDDLINFSFEQVEKKYRINDGSWGNNKNISIQQKVNGSMKMMTAYHIANREQFDKHEKLIDLCFEATNDNHACDHFNIICVLYHCQKLTNYKNKDVKNYAIKRLSKYELYYWDRYGGFSFFENYCQNNFYGAKISKKLPEPDLHGTIMLLWGIVLISDILGFRDELGIKHPIT